ncbi:winged helix DNA-binding protein [Rhodococcus sp. HNM0569]|nr:winged helix DNA-binding protein [Rhodococcus sp. HNM0569]
MARLPAALDRQMQRDGGISQFDYMTMSALSEMRGRRLRLSELARLTGSALSRLSNAMTRLERRGWVVRQVDPGDGRYTLAVLTDAGMAKVDALAPSHVAEVRRVVLDPLTAQQQRVVREAARRIIAAADEAGDERSGR